MITDHTATGSPAVPLLVRAHLASGVAHAAPWGIALDGLLAAELWRDLTTAGGPPADLSNEADPVDLALPLARCEPTTGPWHWASTCAYPEQSADVDVRYWTGRLDHRATEHNTCGSLPRVLSDSRGAYRARHMPLLVTQCAALVWLAVGDPNAIRALLKPITAIGKKRSQGEGAVLDWEVKPARDLDPWTAAHLHPDNTLGRPTPDECLRGRTTAGDGGPGLAGLRPPYMHPARQHHLRLPAYLDQ